MKKTQVVESNDWMILPLKEELVEADESEGEK